ncbi:MAG TPA: hypothetical protein DER60_10095 [Syntrophomonas sp.]|jgi:hypothetical protein|nr:hypothetical protein [Syntrophomonas sp.]
MKKDNQIIIMVLAVLFLATAMGAGFNMKYAREKAALLAAAEIVVLDRGREAARLNMDTLGTLPAIEFTANLKSSIMERAEEHLYTGVALSELFKTAAISLEGRQRVMVRSVDGYIVPLTIKEIEALDNIYLVYKDNREFLGSYSDADGQGPYMIVIRGDRFSQRWAKYVCELDVQ